MLTALINAVKRAARFSRDQYKTKLSRDSYLIHLFSLLNNGEYATAKLKLQQYQTKLIKYYGQNFFTVLNNFVDHFTKNPWLPFTIDPSISGLLTSVIPVANTIRQPLCGYFAQYFLNTIYLELYCTTSDETLKADYLRSYTGTSLTNLNWSQKILEEHLKFVYLKAQAGIEPKLLNRAIRHLLTIFEILANNPDFFNRHLLKFFQLANQIYHTFEQTLNNVDTLLKQLTTPSLNQILLLFYLQDRANNLLNIPNQILLDLLKDNLKCFLQGGKKPADLPKQLQQWQKNLASGGINNELSEYYFQLQVETLLERYIETAQLQKVLDVGQHLLAICQVANYHFAPTTIQRSIDLAKACAAYKAPSPNKKPVFSADVIQHGFTHSQNLTVKIACMRYWFYHDPSQLAIALAGFNAIPLSDQPLELRILQLEILFGKGAITADDQTLFEQLTQDAERITNLYFEYFYFLGCAIFFAQQPKTFAMIEKSHALCDRIISSFEKDQERISSFVDSINRARIAIINESDHYIDAPLRNIDNLQGLVPDDIKINVLQALLFYRSRNYARALATLATVPFDFDQNTKYLVLINSLYCPNESTVELIEQHFQQAECEQLSWLKVSFFDLMQQIFGQLLRKENFPLAKSLLTKLTFTSEAEENWRQTQIKKLNHEEESVADENSLNQQTAQTTEPEPAAKDDFSITPQALVPQIATTAGAELTVTESSLENLSLISPANDISSPRTSSASDYEGRSTISEPHTLAAERIAAFRPDHAAPDFQPSPLAVYTANVLRNLARWYQGQEEKIFRLIKRIESDGYLAYLTGGCLRVGVLPPESGVTEPRDIDIVTNMPEARLKEIIDELNSEYGTDFAQTFKGNIFATKTHSPRIEFYVTADIEDLHRYYTENIVFPVNAFFMTGNKSLIDASGYGIQNINNRIITCSKSSEQRLDQMPQVLLKIALFSYDCDMTWFPHLTSLIIRLTVNSFYQQPCPLDHLQIIPILDYCIKNNNAGKFLFSLSRYNLLRLVFGFDPKGLDLYYLQIRMKQFDQQPADQKPTAYQLVAVFMLVKNTIDGTVKPYSEKKLSQLLDDSFFRNYLSPSISPDSFYQKFLTCFAKEADLFISWQFQQKAIQVRAKFKSQMWQQKTLNKPAEQAPATSAEPPISPRTSAIAFQ